MGCYSVWGCVEGPVRPLQIHSADLCSAYKQYLINVFFRILMTLCVTIFLFFFLPFIYSYFLPSFSGFEEVPFLLLVLLPCTLFLRGNKDCPTAFCPRTSFLSKTGWLFKDYSTTTGVGIWNQLGVFRCCMTRYILPKWCSLHMLDITFSWTTVWCSQ